MGLVSAELSETFSAREGTGLQELWETIVGHRELLESSGELATRRSEQQRCWLERLLDETIVREFRSRPGFRDALALAHEDVQTEGLTVPQAVERLLAESAGRDVRCAAS